MIDVKIKKIEFVKSEENPDMYTPVITLERPSFVEMAIFAQEVFGVRDEYR